MKPLSTKYRSFPAALNHVLSPAPVPLKVGVELLLASGAPVFSTRNAKSKKRATQDTKLVVLKMGAEDAVAFIFIP